MERRTEHPELERIHRAEGIRLLLRRELRHLPQRLLAPIVGISRSSLRKFLALSEPEPRTWARLREWAQDRPEPDVPPGALALALLAAEFPSPHRLRARKHLAHVLARLFAEQNRQPPTWLVEEMAEHRTESPG